jgi:hypothetical protein
MDLIGVVSPQMNSLIQGIKAAYDMLVAQDVSGPRKVMFVYTIYV